MLTTGKDKNNAPKSKKPNPKYGRNSVWIASKPKVLKNPIPPNKNNPQTIVSANKILGGSFDQSVRLLKNCPKGILIPFLDKRNDLPI